MHNNDVSGKEIMHDHMASLPTHYPFDEPVTQGANHFTSYVFLVVTHTCTSWLKKTVGTF